MKKHRVNNNNIDDTELQWILKKYRVDNGNTADIELEWILKKYRVDSNNIDATKFDNNAPVFWLEIQAVLVMYQLLFRSICRANRNDFGNENRPDIIHWTQNEYQVLLSRSTHQMVRNHDIHFDYVSIFWVPFWSEYRLVKSDVRQITPIDDNKDLNNNTCYNFYLYGNRPNNIDTCWYYSDISNNGKIPEDKLNYQTSNINSI